MNRYILVHYGEIGLKGANKKYFTDKLCKRIRDSLQKKFAETFSVVLSLDRIFVKLPNEFDEDKYVDVMKKISGVRNFMFVYEGNLDLQELGDEILENLPENDAETFRVRVKRSQKVPYSSSEAERELGAILLRGGINMKVQMKDAEMEVNVEILNEHAFFAYKKYEGMGGLSSASAARVLCLISAGIDSPVAAYKMMKRGAEVVFVHFDGYPYTDQAERENVKKLVEILSAYQGKTRFYNVLFGEIQKRIATNLEVPPKMLVVLYRRMMIRIAEKISYKEKAKGLLTGDNLGQVASQTSENLFVIHEATTIPLFQPLIGYDKEEIVAAAEKIGTFEISRQPCKDTCAMFVPKNPELKANVIDTRAIEDNLPIDAWVDEAFEGAEVSELS